MGCGYEKYLLSAIPFRARSSGRTDLLECISPESRFDFFFILALDENYPTHPGDDRSSFQRDPVRAGGIPVLMNVRVKPGGGGSMKACKVNLDETVFHTVSQNVVGAFPSATVFKRQLTEVLAPRVLLAGDGDRCSSCVLSASISEMVRTLEQMCLKQSRKQWQGGTPYYPESCGPQRRRKWSANGQ